MYCFISVTNKTNVHNHWLRIKVNKHANPAIVAHIPILNYLGDLMTPVGVVFQCLRIHEVQMTCYSVIVGSDNHLPDSHTVDKTHFICHVLSMNTVNQMLVVICFFHKYRSHQVRVFNMHIHGSLSGMGKKKGGRSKDSNHKYTSRHIFIISLLQMADGI